MNDGQRMTGSNDGQDDAARLRRTRYRAWHRGTREADYLVGGFFDAHHADWDDDAYRWFEALIEEQDVDIMAWAFGRGDPPAALCAMPHGARLTALLRTLDYIAIPR